MKNYEITCMKKYRICKLATCWLYPKIKFHYIRSINFSRFSARTWSAGGQKKIFHFQSLFTDVIHRCSSRHGGLRVVHDIVGHQSAEHPKSEEACGFDDGPEEKRNQKSVELCPGIVNQPEIPQEQRARGGVTYHLKGSSYTRCSLPRIPFFGVERGFEGGRVNIWRCKGLSLNLPRSRRHF